MSIKVARCDTHKVEAIWAKMLKTPDTLNNALGDDKTLTLTDGQREVTVNLDNTDEVIMVNPQRVLRVFHIHNGVRASFNLRLPAFERDCKSVPVEMRTDVRDRLFSSENKERTTRITKAGASV